LILGCYGSDLRHMVVEELEKYDVRPCQRVLT
jgi:hypothetical protein